MRPIIFIAAAVAAFAAAPAALAGIPESGFLVYKESRLASVVEIRHKGSGQLVQSAKQSHGHSSTNPACSDPAYVFSGPRWKQRDPEFLVNAASSPQYVDSGQVLADLLDSAEAWETPFETDCRQPKGKSTYAPEYDGTTRRGPSLLGLVGDDKNVVAFTSLAGTICDGATACVVIDYDGKQMLEADMALERDLTRYGFQDFWTTSDTTWWDDTGGRWAVVDVGTHEFGHFAGLSHAETSPALTMYPGVHDGAQTLGLGDMLGLLARY